MTVHEDVLENTLNEKLTASITGTVPPDNEITNELLTICYLAKIAASMDMLSKSIFEISLSLSRRQ